VVRKNINIYRLGVVGCSTAWDFAAAGDLFDAVVGLSFVWGARPRRRTGAFDFRFNFRRRFFALYPGVYNEYTLDDVLQLSLYCWSKLTCSHSNFQQSTQFVSEKGSFIRTTRSLSISFKHCCFNNDIVAWSYLLLTVSEDKTNKLIIT